MEDADRRVREQIIGIFRQPNYQYMSDAELLTRLLAALDPWYPDDLRTAPPPMEPLKKLRTYRRRRTA